MNEPYPAGQQAGKMQSGSFSIGATQVAQPKGEVTHLVRFSSRSGKESAPLPPGAPFSEERFAYSLEEAEGLACSVVASGEAPPQTVSIFERCPISVEVRAERTDQPRMK